MSDTQTFNSKQIIQTGLIAGVIATGASAIGMVEAFAQRDLISGLFTLGMLLLILPPLGAGYMVAQDIPEEKKAAFLGGGFLTGFVSGLPLLALVILASVVNLRPSLVNISPALIEEILTFGQGVVGGGVMLVAFTSIMGLAGAAIHLIPDKPRKRLANSVIWTLSIGIFSEIAIAIFRSLFSTRFVKFLFVGSGMKPWFAALIFVLAGGITLWVERRKAHREEQGIEEKVLSPQQKRIQLGVIVAIILILPWLTGTYLTEIMDVVGIFVLMGLGLNIVVGFAGLLDLGYVAFFAIGAYTMGVLTSQGDLGITNLSFWAALPISVLVSTLFGVMLGTPVLRMRGDYLAIVTLGFGEIIRIMATSDVLKGMIGGAQGILQIPKPQIGIFTLVQPEHFYYLIVAACALAAFVAWRLRDSRLGRQWMAMREDEDVAEAMGINLVKTKLLAFGIGAAFSGLSGAIFASRLSSIFPASFNLLISINVLCLIIVGGMGSLPGIVVGAVALVGLPELLREFAEYRLLIYGILLVVMMITRPEGLWPSAVIKRELHAGQEEAAPEVGTSGA